MSEVPQRFDHVRRSARWSRLLAISGFTSLLVVSGYLLFSDMAGQFTWIIWGLAAISGAALLCPFVILAWSLVDVILKIEANSHRMYDVLREMQASMEKHDSYLNTLADNVQLSDAARAITHRGRERTALRLAINEEIIRGDWEAAYALVEQLESRHGYKNEAARLRAEVDQSRAQARDHRVQESIEQVHRMMASHDWDDARRQMDQLLSIYPENGDVQSLPALFTKRRAEHKRRLLKEWDESVQRNDVDHGIALLKELDQYLTANEAAALQESARGVFRAKLHNLGVQFSLAVTEHNWAEAMKVGRQIMEEFPNSRMAQEVRERAHVLTKRATEGEGVAVAGARG